MKRFERFVRNIFTNKNVEITEMSPKRYFINPFCDIETKIGDSVQIPESNIKQKVLNITENIFQKLKPTEANAEDGLYLGTAGVSYMFYHISKIPVFSDKKNSLLKLALDYLEPALIVSQKSVKRTNDVPSFILGNSGVYAIASVLFKNTGNDEESIRYRNLFINAGNIAKHMKFLECGSDELFVGRAGYLCGSLWLHKTLNIPPPVNDLFEICNVMVASGREYATRHGSPSPLMYAYYNVEYLGAAHGICSILQMIISVPGYLDANPKNAKLIKDSIDYLLALQDVEGNFPAATDEINRSQNELVHWCHGAPGMIYLMAKAYIVWKEEKYLHSCIKMAEVVWKKGLLKKGPGICHGVAGNGYVFLLMYRLTSDTKYLKRAVIFAEFLENEQFKKEARTPDHPYSLYEGVAGTACFLADLTNPMTASFPFSDIFL